MRQALVLAWMMMPRAGGRDFKDVKKIVAQIFERNLQAWNADHRTFSAAPAKKKAKAKPATKVKSKSKSTVRKTTTKRAKKK